MLTRLKVSGFKNLDDVDIRLGPLTCIVGANGVGKSNLLDAIGFLSELAQKPLDEAARSVRGAETGQIQNLFLRAGEYQGKDMRFEAEMIIPAEGRDDQGNRLKPTTTLRYILELEISNTGALIISHESLEPADFKDELAFASKKWKESAIKKRKDIGGIASSARPATIIKELAKAPPIFLVQQEMRAWRRLVFDPAAMRQPDPVDTSGRLRNDGSGLAAELDWLSRCYKAQWGERWAYAQVASRLSELVDDVRDLEVERDRKSKKRHVLVKGYGGSSYPASLLSDPGLCFLALAAIELSPESGGLICLEEPENGIHPDRISEVVRLLEDIATDARDFPVDADNPLRQVIISTHSPLLVNEMADENLLVAESREAMKGEQRFRPVCFSWLPDTWRCEVQPDARPISRGELLSYIVPRVDGISADEARDKNGSKKPPRIKDRTDLNPSLTLFDAEVQ